MWRAGLNGWFPNNVLCSPAAPRSYSGRERVLPALFPAEQFCPYLSQTWGLSLRWCLQREKEWVSLLGTIWETAGIECFLLSHSVICNFFFVILVFQLGLGQPRLGPLPPRPSRTAGEVAAARAHLLTCSHPFLKAMPSRPVVCDVGVGACVSAPKPAFISSSLSDHWGWSSVCSSKRQDGSKSPGVGGGGSKKHQTSQPISDLEQNRLINADTCLGSLLRR